MGQEVQAGELRDADIHFISLVDKAANRRTFKRMVFKSADAPEEPEPDAGTLRKLWQTLRGFFHQSPDSHGAGASQASVAKVGRKMAKDRLEKLTQAIALLQQILSEVQDEPDGGEEEDSMDRDAVQRLVDEAVAKAVAPLRERIERMEAAAQPKDAGAQAASEPKSEPLTAEAVSKMVEEAVSKAVKPLEERLSVVEKARIGNAAQVDVSKGQVGADFWGGVFLG